MRGWLIPTVKLDHVPPDASKSWLRGLDDTCRMSSPCRSSDGWPAIARRRNKTESASDGERQRGRAGGVTSAYCEGCPSVNLATPRTGTGSRRSHMRLPRRRSSSLPAMPGPRRRDTARGRHHDRIVRWTRSNLPPRPPPPECQLRYHLHRGHRDGPTYPRKPGRPTAQRGCSGTRRRVAVPTVSHRMQGVHVRHSGQQARVAGTSRTGIGAPHDQTVCAEQWVGEGGVCAGGRWRGGRGARQVHAASVSINRISGPARQHDVFGLIRAPMSGRRLHRGRVTARGVNAPE